jgi:Trypsin
MRPRNDSDIRRSRSARAAGPLIAYAVLSACAMAHESDADIAAQEAAVTQAPATTEAPWAVRIGGDTDCTAEVLTPHWLLTAAHCLHGKPEVSSGRTVRAVNPASGITSFIYSGSARYILYPDYVHDDPIRVHDIALVQLLDGNGIIMPSYARIYRDGREPWAASFSGSRRFEVAGFGLGTDPGGSSTCEDGMIGVKRLGTEFELTGQSHMADFAPAKVAARFTGVQQLCDGDSGSPWLLRRGGTLMQFAIHSGSRGKLNGDKAATLVGPKLDWILAHTFFRGRPVECREDTRDGFRFLSCQTQLPKIWLDAEHGGLTAPMAVGRSGNASRSRFVSVPAGTTASGGSVRLAFSAPTTAGYRLWLRTSAPSTSANTFNVVIDGSAALAHTLPVTTAGAFQWNVVQAGGTARVFNLTSGAHTLDIQRGLAGAQLDRVLLTSDPSFQPFDTFIEAETGILVPPMQFVAKPIRQVLINTIHGTGFIRVPEGAGPGAIAIYFLGVPVRADYLVHARTSLPAQDQEGFRAMLDPFSDADDWLWRPPSATGWAWNAISGAGRGPMHVILDGAGNHMLALRRNNPGAAIDRLFVTNDPAFVPADVELVLAGNVLQAATVGTVTLRPAASQ